jgi:hypothetical protein
MWRWSAAKNARFDGVCVDSRYPVDYKLLQAFVRISMSAVRWVRSYSRGYDCLVCQQALLEIVRSCPNVRKLNLAAIITVDPSTWDNCLIKLTNRWPNLTELTLDDVPLSTQGMTTALSHCKAIESLAILTASQDIPRAVAIPTLKSLNITSEGMNDDVMVAVGQICTKLEILKMFSHWHSTRHRVTDVGMRAVLRGCPLLRVTEVELAGTISNDLRVEMAQRRDLVEFFPDHWRDMDDELARGVLKVSPNLVNVALRNCEWLTDATLAVCAQHCLSLKELTLLKCPYITNGCIQDLGTVLGHQLLTVELKGCCQLGDDAVFAIAERCPKLRKVYCPPGTSDLAVQTLAAACPGLTCVDVYDTDVGDAGLAAVTTHCTKLIGMYMNDGCHHVTLQGLCILLQQSACLKTLFVPYRLYGQLSPFKTDLYVGYAKAT